LTVKAKGHGRRQRCGTERYGFPIRHAPAQKFFMGFQTGDLVEMMAVPNLFENRYKSLPTEQLTHGTFFSTSRLQGCRDRIFLV
jgi:hypothetical protein